MPQWDSRACGGETAIASVLHTILESASNSLSIFLGLNPVNTAHTPPHAHHPQILRPISIPRSASLLPLARLVPRRLSIPPYIHNRTSAVSGQVVYRSARTTGTTHPFTVQIWLPTPRRSPISTRFRHGTALIRPAPTTRSHSRASSPPPALMPKVRVSVA